MKSERELFEDWCHINDEFCTHRYTDNCQEYSDDYTQSAWLAWQARVPEGYVVVPVDPTEDMIMAGCMEHGGYDVIDSKSIYKAMIEAVEK